MSIAFDSGTISVPNVPVLIGELQAFKRLADGRNSGLFHRRYGAPTGLHDDCVIALALAWWGLKTGLWGAHKGNPWQGLSFMA
ncbi:MAG: hypothetical protein NTW87_04285 [Planctomycetota bacterium]|nr:hypothetical protein [Planctomycetota bacterium]